MFGVMVMVRVNTTLTQTQRKIEHPGDRSFVMLRVLRRKQPKQVSKQKPQPWPTK